MRLLFLLFVLSSLQVSAQTETGPWNKKEISYEIESHIRQRDYTFKSNEFPDIAIEGLTKTYWFFISDLDGDNCPFRPSCSEYFAESVSKTNIFRGTLMFFDRFTRDLNFINREKEYQRSPDGHFFDPPDKYIF